MSSVRERAVVLLRRGPRWDETKPLGEQRGVHEHIAYNVSLHERGLLGGAGPFHRPSELVEDELVGLVVYRAGVDEAAERARDDPAVRSGLMEVDVFPWHV